MLYTGNGGTEHFGQREAYLVLGVRTIVLTGIINLDCVSLLIIGQETVIRKLVNHPKTYQQGHSHACGKADNIKGAVHFIVPHIAPGDFQVILYHTNKL